MSLIIYFALENFSLSILGHLWAKSTQLYQNKSRKLWVDQYADLTAVVEQNPQLDLDQLGTRIILLSFFTGSTRHMQSICQVIDIWLAYQVYQRTEEIACCSWGCYQRYVLVSGCFLCVENAEYKVNQVFKGAGVICSKFVIKYVLVSQWPYFSWCVSWQEIMRCSSLCGSDQIDPHLLQSWGSDMVPVSSRFAGRLRWFTYSLTSFHWLQMSVTD